jgi:hypothetical protein
VIGGLLRTNRKRASLLVGSPESGKSTLAIQGGVAVARGIPFLGRPTTQGKVLYWQSEEDVADAREDFIASGMRAADPIIVLHSNETEDHCDELNKVLCQHPDTRLVIIETLDDFLKTEDIGDNNDNREKFARLDEEVISKHRAHCAFLILHWLKKSDTQHAQHGLNIHKILGGTCIAGKTDAKIFIRQVSDEDQRRIIQISVRKGEPLEPTYLVFDPATKTSTLGATVASEKAQNKIAKKDLAAVDEDTRINAAIHANPGRPKNTIISLVGGDTTRIGKRIDERIAAGDITEVKGGKRGNAKLLYLTGHEPVIEEHRRETVCR